MGHSWSLNDDSCIGLKGIYKVTLQIKVKLQFVYISVLKVLAKKLRSQIGARPLGARNDNSLKGLKEAKVNLGVG
jgi:hypothetical protein